MGLFSDNKQNELNMVAIEVNQHLEQFTNTLTKTNGFISPQAKAEGDTLEGSILKLYNLAVKYEQTNKYVVWLGQRMALGQLFPMLVLILEDEIEKYTTYRFNRFNGVLR